MTEETRPGFLANYKIVRPGPLRLGPARNFKTRPGPGPARIRPGPVDTSSTYSYISLRTRTYVQRTGIGTYKENRVLRTVR